MKSARCEVKVQRKCDVNENDGKMIEMKNLQLIVNDTDLLGGL